MTATKFTMIDDHNADYFLPLLPRKAKGDEVMSGVIVDDRPVAALLANVSGRTISIISIFVLPEHRRNRVATFLIDNFCREMGQRGADMVILYGPDENGLKECLIHNDFSIAFVDKYYSVSVHRLMNDKDVMNKLRSFKRMSTGRNVMTMKEIMTKIPEESRRTFAKTLDKRGVNPSAFINAGFDEKLSFGVVIGTYISGIILTKRMEIKSEVVVESLITISDRMDILALLSRFGNEVIQVVGEKGVISFVISDSTTDTLLVKLLGKNVLTVRNAIRAGKRL